MRKLIKRSFSMKRLSTILLLLTFSCSAICQPFTMNVGGTLITVYRDNGAWDRAYNAYDFGFDYCFSRNLKFSAVGSLVNDRRLSAGSHNYFMFDFQMGLRF